MVFSYLAHHVAARGRAVATTLPVRPGEIVSRSGAVPAYFTGLLPEGRRLTALRTATKTSGDDELTLLLAVGDDVVGDARIVPHGADGSPSGDDNRLGHGAPDLAATSFAELYHRSTGADPGQLDRVGLPGVQDKVSGRMLAFPVGGPQGRYLLKLDPPELPHLVHNEAFFLGPARQCGLATASARVIHDGDGRAGLLVERFDRAARGEELLRLGQEDGCQVLGRYPADEYVITAEEVVAGLAVVTAAPVVAARELLRQLAFAYLTGNGDAHAKNLSVGRAGSGEWRVTPAYDVPSSHPYGDTTMALAIDGRDREDLTWRSFVALGDATGVRPHAVRRVLTELVGRSGRWIAQLDQLPFDARRRHRLRRLVEDRRRKLTPPAT